MSDFPTKEAKIRSKSMTRKNGDRIETERRILGMEIFKYLKEQMMLERLLSRLEYCEPFLDHIIEQKQHSLNTKPNINVDTMVIAHCRNELIQNLHFTSLPSYLLK